MIVVNTFMTEMEARSAELILRAAGIPSRVAGGHLDDFGGYHGGGPANVELLVDEEDRDQAEKILGYAHGPRRAEGQQDAARRRWPMRVVWMLLALVLATYICIGLVVRFGS